MAVIATEERRSKMTSVYDLPTVRKGFKFHSFKETEKRNRFHRSTVYLAPRRNDGTEPFDRTPLVIWHHLLFKKSCPDEASPPTARVFWFYAFAQRLGFLLLSRFIELLRCNCPGRSRHCITSILSAVRDSVSDKKAIWASPRRAPGK